MAVKYKWLADCLQDLIERSIKKGINKLPTEAELSRMYKVSRQTVRQALLLLEHTHQITKRQGSGSYITGLKATSEENTIGILLPTKEEYIYPGVLHDIQNTLYQNGYLSQVYETRNRTYKEREILLELLKKPVRALIVEGCKSALPNPNLDLYRQLKKKGIKLLFLHNYYPALTNSSYLKDNNLQASALLVRHLFDKGHTAIGGIFHAEDLQGIERFQGFMETMRDYHLAVPDHRIVWFRTSDVEGLRKRQETDFLKTAVQHAFRSCTAVVCYNDEIAYYFYKTLLSAGRHLPNDLAIVAYDNTYLSKSDVLPLTSVAHKPHEMGQEAAYLCIEALKGLTVSSREISWELVVRNSAVTPMD